MDSTNLPIKPAKKSGAHLNDREKFFIARCLGFYEPAKEIVAKFEKEFGRRITTVHINRWKEHDDWRPLIERFRAEYEAKIMELPLASKHKRVERLSEIHELMFKNGMLEESIKPLTQIKDEIEGETNGRPNIFITQFNQLTDEEIEEKKLKLLTSLERLRKQKGLTHGLRTKAPEQTPAEEIIDATYTEGIEETQSASG